MCLELKKKRNTVANNKICPACSKVFAQNSNRDRHVKNFHQDSKDDIVINNQRDEDMYKETIPLMVLAIHTKSLQVSLPNHLYLIIWIWRMCCPHLSKWKICRVEARTEKFEARTGSYENQAPVGLLDEFNPLRANPTKWPNTLKQFAGKLLTDFLSVFGHFVNLALKGLTKSVLMKLKRDLKDNHKEVVKFITDCFDDMLEGNGLILWLVNGTGY